jgi:hypothetical protein
MAPSYRFGKGPIVAALEATLRDPTKFDKLYDDLVAALVQIKASQPTVKSQFKQSLANRDLDHLDKDVFGEGQQDPDARAEGRQRRLVYYEGLKRSMDDARRLGQPGAPAPIEVFWGCGQRVNECWISWNKAGRPGITLFVLSTDPAIAEVDEPGITPGFVLQPADQKAMYVVRPDGGGDTEVYEADPSVIGI